MKTRSGAVGKSVLAAAILVVGCGLLAVFYEHIPKDGLPEGRRLLSPERALQSGGGGGTTTVAQVVETGTTTVDNSATTGAPSNGATTTDSGATTAASSGGTTDSGATTAAGDTSTGAPSNGATTTDAGGGTSTAGQVVVTGTTTDAGGSVVGTGTTTTGAANQSPSPSPGASTLSPGSPTPAPGAPAPGPVGAVTTTYWGSSGSSGSGSLGASSASGSLGSMAGSMNSLDSSSSGSLGSLKGGSSNWSGMNWKGSAGGFGPIAYAAAFLLLGLLSMIFAYFYKQKVVDRIAPLQDSRQPQGFDNFAHGHFECMFLYNLCLHTWCCPWVRAAHNNEVTGICPFWSTFFAYCCCAIWFTTCCGQQLLTIYFRRELKHFFQIEDHCFDDICCTCFCPLCTIGQEAMDIDDATGVRVDCCCNLKDFDGGFFQGSSGYDPTTGAGYQRPGGQYY